MKPGAPRAAPGRLDRGASPLRRSHRRAVVKNLASGAASLLVIAEGVLLLLRPWLDRAQPSYREGPYATVESSFALTGLGVVSRLTEGTLDDLAAATHAAKVTRDAVALSTIVLTSAPLWAAALRGLVFG